MNHSTVSGCGEIEHSENSRKSGQQKQTVKKLHSCPITCVGATIGRPSTYRSNAFSGIVSCKANGRLWETRGPGMPGPYRAAAKKRTPTQPSRRGSAAESLPFQGRCSVSKDLPLRGRCPEGAEGENLAIARNISDSRTVLSPTACGRSPLAEGAKG